MPYERRMSAPRWYEGSCHCGSVGFRVRLAELDALDCNCSVCTKKGHLHLIVPLEDFEVLRGAEQLVTYTFNTHVAKHRFCRVCGISPFYTPRSHPDQIDANARCLDGFRELELNVRPFDGRHWEDNVAQIRTRGDA